MLEALAEIRILTASLDVHRDGAPDLLVDGDLVDTGDRLELRRLVVVGAVSGVAVLNAS